jgi:serine/threonine-protein kinase
MHVRDSQSADVSKRQQRLEEAVLKYERAKEAGRPVAVSDLLAEYSEVAWELREYFSALAQVSRVARPMRPPKLETDALPSGWTPDDRFGATSADDRDALRAALGATSALEPLGRGGMGAVYRGEDPVLGRELAVKVLRADHRGRADLDRRFVEEARLGGRLDHPGVVPVHALGRLPDGRPYFTMKLVRGRTLAELLKKLAEPEEDPTLQVLHNPLLQDRPRLLKVFEQICQTLAYAHGKSVIHRDLKPLNVMVGAFGEVQVMDWGFAKIVGTDGASRAGVSADTPVASGTDALTLAGQAMGTPAYMPPEQARGELDELDERSDVFGLGAILCEVLTGHPPYCGRTQEEVFERARTGDLADALERLEGCKADEELVHLAKRCLAPKPADRPRDAGNVTQAVGAYLTGVEARRQQAERDRAAAEARADAEARERLAADARARAERRARRVQLALAASVLGLVVLGGGSGAWWWHQRVLRAQGCELELTAAQLNLGASRWSEAEQALARAESWMSGGGPPELRWRVQRAKDDTKLGAKLDEIRLNQSNVKDDHFDIASAHEEYAAAFRSYGIDVLAMLPEEASALVTASAIRAALLVALDNWASSDLAAQTRLYAVANAADASQPRRELRTLVMAKDGRRLKELLDKPTARDQPPQTLYWLSKSLAATGHKSEALALLISAQREYPHDFWVNHDLAFRLHFASPPRIPEAVGYYRAAVALRPSSPGALLNLGNALADMNDQDGAIACYKSATIIDPRYASAYYNWGNRLKEQRRYVDAASTYRHAIRLKPDYAPAYCNLGAALVGQQRPTEAEQQFLVAIRLKPGLAAAHNGLGSALHNQGRHEEAIQSYHEALRIKPDLASAHYNLGYALADVGRPAEAEPAYRMAIRLKPDYAMAHCNLGHTLRQLGRLDSALESLRRGHELGRQQSGWSYPSEQWVTRCERLIAAQAKLPAALAGQWRPDDPKEFLVFAELCQEPFQRRFAAATHFYAEAFAAGPMLADDMQSQYRYNAARAAALAAAGKGQDVAQLGATERLRLRTQALEWLRAELTARVMQLATEKRAAQLAARQSLQHWQKDPDLTSVRDAEALKQLPEGERPEWAKLWSDVADLVRTAEGGK